MSLHSVLCVTISLYVIVLPFFQFYGSWFIYGRILPSALQLHVMVLWWDGISVAVSFLVVVSESNLVY